MIWIIFIKILKNCSPNKQRKILIVFDDVTADMFSNKNLRGRKLNNYLVLSQFYFAVPKHFKLN